MIKVDQNSESSEPGRACPSRKKSDEEWPPSPPFELGSGSSGEGQDAKGFYYRIWSVREASFRGSLLERN